MAARSSANQTRGRDSEIINTVASPDPYPNLRGGGELPYSDECNEGKDTNPQPQRMQQVELGSEESLPSENFLQCQV